MKLSRQFYQKVWRFNALAIALCAISVILFISAFAGFMILKQMTRERHVSANLVTNNTMKSDISSTFSIGRPSLLAGTSFVMAEFYESQKYDALYLSSKDSRYNTVNHLLIDTRTGNTHWLVPGLKQLFLQQVGAYDKKHFNNDNEEDKRNLVSIFYTLIEKDTDGNGRLTDDDKLSFAFSGPTGNEFAILQNGIDKVYSMDQITDDTFLFLYEKNKETFSEIYSLPSVKLLHQVKVLSP